MAKAMAATGRDFKDIKTKPKRKNKIGLIVGLMITLLLILALVWIFVFNAFGIRDQHIFPALANVPFVGNFVPDTEHSEPTANVEELEQQIQQLQTNIANLQAENQRLNTLTTAQAAEINSQSTALINFENQHSQFAADRYEFDRMVAGQEPRDFERFFATMNPETAATIYEENVQQRVISEQTRDFLSMFHEMRPRDSVQGLEAMMPAQTALVVDILEALPQDVRADLLSLFEVENMSTLILLMSQDIEL